MQNKKHSPFPLTITDFRRINTFFNCTFKKVSISFLFCLIPFCVFSQSIDYKRLEKEVYELNNKYKYKESQKKLFSLLASKEVTAVDKYYIYLYLSYTYKRLYDYDAVLKYLNLAIKAIDKTEKNTVFIRNIQTQKAFAYFDIRKYDEANVIMDSLEARQYELIFSEDIPKLVMQKGYIDFLNRNYKKALLNYNKAINMMELISPCDLPMITVKKIQLFHAIKDSINMHKAYKKSIRIADSCNILKYNMYAKSELLNIFKLDKKYKKAFVLQKEYDSVKNLYNENNHQKTLLIDKAKILEENNSNLKSKRNLYIVIIIICLLIACGCIFLLFFYRPKKELKKHIEAQKTVIKEGNSSNKKTINNNLTKKEKEVHELLKEKKSYKEISDTLNISINTLKFHVKNINRKLKETEEINQKV